ncbi:hypothetical protein [Rubellicoccus peritrichatus]|uniref:Thiamine-binding protein domain-containing protein n=1 Tax=Rubellicoccus peritrichatus TaxID=3080537 RepID=A0AAQ3L6E4_9BACT|nr:hypothetical protein [Puniceicoccus sp. CR14]WOO40160.1 hypothetical protein RZN69_16180 [Puniceicoccus sp. CR14]
MITTLEISMYPFREDYRSLIQDCIAKLKSYADLKVIPGPTSSVVVGEYARVMECLTEVLEWSYEEYGRAVFVTKILVGYDAD